MLKWLTELLWGPDEVAWNEIADGDRTTTGHLSKKEALCIDRYECPDCGGEIRKGPEGCGSTNVGCRKCGHAFNMALGFGCGDRLEPPHSIRWKG